MDNIPNFYIYKYKNKNTNKHADRDTNEHRYINAIGYNNQYFYYYTD